jgi:hypothetical protein
MRNRGPGYPAVVIASFGLLNVTQEPASQTSFVTNNVVTKPSYAVNRPARSQSRIPRGHLLGSSVPHRLYGIGSQAVRLSVAHDKPRVLGQ